MYDVKCAEHTDAHLVYVRTSTIMSRKYLRWHVYLKKTDSWQPPTVIRIYSANVKSPSIIKRSRSSSSDRTINIYIFIGDTCRWRRVRYYCTVVLVRPLVVRHPTFARFRLLGWIHVRTIAHTLHST